MSSARPRDVIRMIRANVPAVLLCLLAGVIHAQDGSASHAAIAVTAELDPASGGIVVTLINRGDQPVSVHLASLRNLAQAFSASPDVDRSRVELRDADFIDPMDIPYDPLPKLDADQLAQGVGHALLLEPEQFVGERLMVWELAIWDELVAAIADKGAYLVEPNLVLRIPGPDGQPVIPGGFDPRERRVGGFSLDAEQVALLKDLQRIHAASRP